MKKFWMKFNQKIKKHLYDIINDTAQRKYFLLFWINIILAVVSFIMAILNKSIDSDILLYCAFGFFVACGINAFLLYYVPKMRSFASILFFIESTIVLVFLFLSSSAEGLSILWVCFVPSFTLLVLGRKSGSIISIFAFLVISFFFWTPIGRSILNDSYSGAFMLRFPFIYIAMYLVSLLIETVRMETQKQLIKVEQGYRHLSRHDPLTGLYNRYGFYELLEKKNVSKMNNIAVILMDVDDFKNVNDTYGHLVGDMALKEIAKSIENAMHENCAYCRWGGEEFLVFLKNPKDPFQTAERIMQSIRDTKIYVDEKHSISITVSMGLCTAEDLTEFDELEMNDVIRIADQCLYQAKNNGKNCLIQEKLKR